MKSMLQEASSVAKALEQAWVESGRPAEFSIHVLDTGEKNFLGFCKRPAVVSIAYTPKRCADAEQGRSRVRECLQGAGNRQPTVNRSRGNAVPPRDQVHHREAQRPEHRYDDRRSQQGQPHQEERQHNNQEVAPIWQAEWVTDVSGWLNELLEKLGHQVSFATRQDGATLLIQLSKNIFDNDDDERSLCLSLSYLLVQFLKKKYKKKLRGYHLVISSRTQSGNDRNKQTTP